MDHYEIRHPEIELLIRRLGQHVHAALPEGWGFTLLLFEYGQHGQLFYISSAQRADVCGVMRQWLQKEAERS